MIGFNYLGKMGQLGNQMFQYASLKGIARKNGHNFCIPNHKEIFDVMGNSKISIFISFDDDFHSKLQKTGQYQLRNFQNSRKLYLLKY